MAPPSFEAPRRNPHARNNGNGLLVGKHETGRRTHGSNLSSMPKKEKVRKKPGKFPPKEAETESEPLEQVDIDLMRPLTVKTPKGEFVLNALTVIDPATGWFEIKETANGSAEATADAFNDSWLTRCPRPKCTEVQTMAHSVK